MGLPGSQVHASPVTPSFSKRLYCAQVRCECPQMPHFTGDQTVCSRAGPAVERMYNRQTSVQKWNVVPAIQRWR